MRPLIPLTHLFRTPLSDSKKLKNICVQPLSHCIFIGWLQLIASSFSGWAKRDSLFNKQYSSCSVKINILYEKHVAACCSSWPVLCFNKLNPRLTLYRHAAIVLFSSSSWVSCCCFCQDRNLNKLLCLLLLLAADECLGLVS